MLASELYLELKNSDRWDTDYLGALLTSDGKPFMGGIFKTKRFNTMVIIAPSFDNNIPVYISVMPFGMEVALSSLSWGGVDDEGNRLITVGKKILLEYPDITL